MEASAPGVAGAADRTPEPSGRALAESLAGPLAELCDARLSEIRWFRTDWQRGGAATAHATWRDRPGEAARRVVVKLPVNNRELTWMRRIQDPDSIDPATGGCLRTAPDPTHAPRLFASGERLDHYELAWIVIEELPHGPLGGRWHDDHIARIAEAIAAFAARVAAYAVDRGARHEDWEGLVGRARDALRENLIADRQRWRDALRTVSSRLDGLAEEWESREPLEWIHGDLHFANAMSRSAMEAGPVCLIDFAEVRPGHWIEDAVYLERQLWARPERLRARRPVKAIAEARRAAGVESPGDFNRLATLRRCLLAATAPAFLKSEGAPPYLAACLARLETSIAQLA